MSPEPPENHQENHQGEPPGPDWSALGADDDDFDDWLVETKWDSARKARDWIQKRGQAEIDRRISDYRRARRVRAKRATTDDKVAAGFAIAQRLSGQTWTPLQIGAS